MRRLTLMCAAAFGSSLLAGCTQDMYDQPRLEPLEASRFFADGTSARPQVEGTAPPDQPFPENPKFTGRKDGVFLANIPAPPGGGLVTIDRAILARGRERFGIYCSPCHGLAGEGDGMG